MYINSTRRKTLENTRPVWWPKASPRYPGPSLDFDNTYASVVRPHVRCNCCKWYNWGKGAEHKLRKPRILLVKGRPMCTLSCQHGYTLTNIYTDNVFGILSTPKGKQRSKDNKMKKLALSPSHNVPSMSGPYIA